MRGKRQKIGFYLLTVLVVSLSGCSALLFREKHSYIRYPVQSGDTLYAISKRFAVPVDTIQSKNNIRDPRRLVVGQQLKIPYHGQDLARSEQDNTVSRASFGGLSVRGSTSDRSGLSRVNLGRSERFVGQLKMPVTGGGSYISSKFGRRWLNFHEGIDIAGPIGLPIVAAHAGKVVYSGNGIRGYGNLVVLKTDGLITIYGHNRRNLVRVGQSVSRGKRIAELGQSGKASGPHVHFETRIPDAEGRYMAVNPLAFFK